jgi:3-oxoacyl-[acyl-carrier protein] reductase
MLLGGKTAVITGSNKGIGLETLKVFLKNDVKKIFACTRKISKDFREEIDQLQKKSKSEIIIVNLDLTDEKSVKEATNEILANSANIDVLVNNAGAISTSLFQMTKIEEVKNIFDVNFFSQYLFSQQILKGMIKNKKGSIIFISSTSALDGNIGRSAYSSSKNAINSLAITLSKELGPRNIRVNVVAPGLTNTDMMKNNTSSEKIKEVTDSCSLKRYAEPNEIANIVLFLSSELSSYMTGQILRVDGGMK